MPESPVEHGNVVAGYDGSDEARAAALWAAAEAANRGRRLVVVNVITPLIPPLTPGPPLPPTDVLGDEQMLREHGERLLAEFAQQARQTWPGLTIDTRIATGRPAQVLSQLAGEAELLVIGSSGRTGLPRMLLGSTAAELVHSVEQPIMVVRHVKDPLPARGGRVVVGVDGSSTSARAIGFAYDFADRHGCELVAVHAWSDLPMDALAPVRSWDEDWEPLREKGDKILAEALSGYAQRYPDVPVHHVVSLDRPTHALLEQAEGAALLVVGSHGRGAIRSLLLGSVSHAVIYHAPCPVAVLRGDTHD